MARPRATSTAEFKPRAARMVTDQTLSVADAARQPDVGEHLRRDRRKAFLARGDAAFPGHGLPVADNLLDRDFDPPGPNESWSADITSVPTREGWGYLAVVEDLFRRLIVGWAMDGAMTSRLVVDAREMAVRRRLPGEGLVAHADRGSPYAGAHDQGLLGRHGIVCSMSRVAQCRDNAPVESFFGSPKRELGVEVFTTREEARAAIFEYVGTFDNRARRHSSPGAAAARGLGRRSPSTRGRPLPR